MPMIGALVLLGGLLAAAPPPSASSRRVPMGVWGGAHAKLDVYEASAGLELDCAHGTIEGPLRVGKGGRFRAKGLLQHEGGAQFAQEVEGRPARFSGRLKGRVLTIDIVTEDGQKAGPYQLERGAAAQLVKCQ